MRSLVYTNPDGITITFDEKGIYEITSLTGLGVPEENIQSQKSPFQDGTTPIDQLLEPREIELEGIIAVGNDQALRYGYRRTMCATLNPKLGPGSLVYTNDAGSKYIEALPIGPIFNNKNANDGNQKYQITFHCHGPYWQDISDTTETFSSLSVDKVITITGDVESSFVATITGIGDTPKLEELIQGKFLEYTEVMDQKLILDTKFGHKTAILSGANSFVLRQSGHAINDCYFSEHQGCWIAVGELGFILTSQDGTVWTVRQSGVATDLTRASFSNYLKQWCVVGEDGVILTSSDAIVWTSRASGIATHLYGINYSSTLGQWCAVGANGVILTSALGVTWASPASGVATTLNSVKFADGKWLVVGDAGVILSSTDGSTWVEETSGVAQNLMDIAYSPALDLWCAVGTVERIIVSNDGITWTSKRSGGNTIYGIFWSIDLNLWCAVGNLTNKILTSPDGSTWTQVTLAASYTQYAVGYSELNNLWCMVGATNAGIIQTSPTTATWTIKISGALWSFNKIGYSAFLEQLCAVGINGQIYTSPDGIVWTSRSSGTAVTLYDLCWSDHLSQWCVVGEDGVILTSPTGVTWTVGTTGTADHIDGIDYSELQRRYCATGSANAFESIDGITWIAHAFTVITGAYNMHYCRTLDLWFCSDDQHVVSSPDTVTWTVRAHLANVGLLSFRYSIEKGIFLIVGGTGSIYTSTDLITWETRTSGVATHLRDSSYDPILERWYVFGDSGVVLTSDDLIAWTNISGGPNGISYYGAAFMSSVGKVFACGQTGIVIRTIGETEENVIQYLNIFSDFFQLQPGRNVLRLTAATGVFLVSIVYRNKYIGV